MLPLLGTAAHGALRRDDAITEAPRLGSTEIWSVIDATEDAHPIHLHLVQFQVLDRHPFDAEMFVLARASEGTIAGAGRGEGYRYHGRARQPARTK